MKLRIIRPVFLLLCCLLSGLLLAVHLQAQNCLSVDWRNPRPQGEALRAAYSDVDKVILAGEAGMVIRSQDSGATWQRIHVPFDSLLEDIVFTSPTEGIMVGRRNYNEGTILRTTDAGMSWTEVLGDTAAGELMSVAFPTAQTGYTCGRYGRFLKTTDGGLNWFHLPWPYSTDITDLWFTSQDTGYAISQSLFKTTDGGMTWVGTILSGAKSVAFSNPQTGVVGCSNGNSFCTQDAGATWGLVPTGSNINFLEVLAINDSSFLLVGGSQMFVSRDHGQSYLPPFMLNPLPYGNFTYCASSGGGLYLGAGYGYVGRSSNLGQSFTALQSQGMFHDLRSIWFTSPTTGYAVGASALYKTTDGADTWSANTAVAGVSVHFPNADTGYVVNGSMTVHRTTNGGATWTQTTQSWFNNTVCKVRFLDGRKGFVFSQQGGLKKTTNAGSTWTTVLPGNTGASFLDATFVNANLGYAVGQQIHRTVDGGNTWTSLPLPFTAKSVYFLNDSTGFIGGQSARVAKTTNYGATWTPYVFPFTNGWTVIPVHAIDFLNDSVGIAVSGPDMGLCWITTDGGNTWPTRHTGMQSPMFDFKWINSSQGIAVGNRGSILRISLGSETPIVTSSPILCGPGPATLQAQGKGTLRWYADAQGTQLMGFGNNFQSPTVNATDTFYVSNFQGLCESNLVPMVVTVLPLPAAPLVHDTTRCGPGLVLLESNASLTSHWYTDTTQAPIATGSTYSTNASLPLSTYYAASWDGQCHSIFVSVSVTVLNVPQAPIGQGVANCGPTSPVLTAASADSILWYASPTGGSVQSTGPFWSVGLVNQTTTFGVAAFNGSCESAIVPIVVSILPIPAPALSIDTARCGAGTFLLTGSGGSNFHWYVDTNATVSGTGISWTSPVVQQQDTFWLRSWDGSCEGDPVSVVAVVHPLPNVPTISGPFSVNQGGTYTYGIPFQPNVSYAWQVVNGSGVSAADTIAVTWWNPGAASISVIVTDTSGCSNGNSLNVTVLIFTSTSAIALPARLVVYPNPSAGSLHFQLLGVSSVDRILTIHDAQGGMVFRSNLASSDDQSYSFSMDDLSSGIYFVRISGEDGTFQAIWQLVRE